MYRPREERPSTVDKDFADDHIRLCIDNHDWTLATDEAHVSLIRDEIIAAIESGKAPYVRFDRPDHILPAVKAANLPMKRELEQALSDAWGRSRFLRCVAFDKTVLDQFHAEGHQDSENASTFLSIIQNLGEKNRWQMKAHVQEAVDDAAKRQRLINNIVGVGA